MLSEKEYNPQEPVPVNLCRKDWDTVLHWLTYGADYHSCKKYEWLANCADKRMAGEKAAEHEKAAAEAERLYKIIKATLHPAPPPETE